MPSTPGTLSRIAMKYLRPLFAISTTAGLVLGAGVFGAAVPEAEAQTTYRTVSGGSFDWGFKQSFRSYITGPIAKGSIDVGDGASYDGTSFSFPPRADGTVVDGDNQGTISLQGSVHFTGHHAGGSAILDTTMSDVKIRIDGNRAEIIVDVVAREFKGTSYEDIGDFIISDDVAIATVNLTSPANFTSEEIDLSGSAVLSAQGATAFGNFYESGERLDNTVGKLTLGNSTTAGTTSASGGSGGSGTADCSSGALGVMTGGTQQEGLRGTIQEINDTMALWNNLLVNTDRMFCNIESLQERFKPKTPVAAAAVTDKTTNDTASDISAAPGASAAAASDTNPSAQSGISLGNSGAGASAAANNGTAVCAAEGGLGVTQASAQWGVKQSFQNYIRGSIAKGRWSLSGVGYENQQFLFAGSTGSVNPADNAGSILFPGSLHFSGHGGTLNLHMSDVEVRFSGNTGDLIADITSSDMEGTSTSFGRTVLGTLGFDALNVSESQVSGDATVTLTAAGSQAFADFYETGQQLDPISIQASLGGAANCAENQGATASGAALSGVSTGGMGAVEAGATSPTFGETTSDSIGGGPGGADSQFQIRSAGEESSGSLGLDSGTTIMLIVAAFIVAGGSMTRFTAGNPAG